MPDIAKIFDVQVPRISERPEQQTVEEANQVPNESQPQAFKCDHCPKVYYDSRQLGGHMSKAHPLKSEAYRIKQIKRTQRTRDREIVQTTKAFIRNATKDDDISQGELVKLQF